MERRDLGKLLVLGVCGALVGVKSGVIYASELDDTKSIILDDVTLILDKSVFMVHGSRVTNCKIIAAEPYVSIYGTSDTICKNNVFTNVCSDPVSYRLEVGTVSLLGYCV